MKYLLSLALGLIALAPRANLQDDMNAARDATRLGRFERLNEIAERTDATILAAYPRYWQLNNQLENQTGSAVQAFLQTHAGSPLADKLRGDWLKVLVKRSDWAQFEREWPKLILWDKGSEVHCGRLQLAMQHNDVKLLAREGKPLWFTPKGLSDACAPVFETLFSLGLLEQNDAWQRLRLAFDANNPDFAAQLLPRLGQPVGIDRKLINAIAAKPAKAASLLALDSRGGRELALFAISRLARSDANEGLSLLSQLSGQLPEAERRYAQSKIAYHAARKLDDRALDWFAQGLPLADLDTDSLAWYARSALRQNQWAAVIKAIAAMELESQQEAGWRYWQARAQLEIGHREQAMPTLVDLAGESHFYGLLAREELGTFVDNVAPQFKANAADMAAIRQLPGVERALSLYAMDWRTEAVREWNWSMRGLSDQQLIAAAELARQEKWYDRAIYAAERTKTIHDFSLRYLAPYRDITTAYAKDVNLDEAWIYGLIRQESRFVSGARSGVGANGLMQLMPATARWVAKKMGLPFEPSAVNEIGNNIQLGTWYLRYVLDTLGRQPVLATAAYNAGPSRARAWQANRAIEGAIYAESIPFKETRDYVKKVMSNAIHYSHAFGVGEASLKKRLGTIAAKGNNDTFASDDTLVNGTPSEQQP